MLELLLTQYEDVFGEPFPLREVAGKPEIEVINILYDCVRKKEPFTEYDPVPNRFPDAPGSGNIILDSDVVPDSDDSDPEVFM